MPDLAPFRGLRYAGGPDLSRTTAPPYDVIDASERADLLANHPNNPIRLILPDPNAVDPYAEAARTWATWRAEGTLVLEAGAALYAYCMEAPVPGGGTHRTTGVIGALALPRDRADGDVLPHERTLAKAKSDRMALLRATRANFDPIWGLTLATGLEDLLVGVEPRAFALDAGGVRHEIGVILDDERIAAIRSLVGARPIVLADGHHRFETACSYRDEVGGPGADAILALVVELDDAQLDVRPFHRLVSGAPPDLRRRLAAVCTVRDLGPVGPESIAALVESMAAEDALGLIDSEGTALLCPSDGMRRAVDGVEHALRDVDAARFDAAIRPLLGDATLGYRADAEDVAASVARGDAEAAIMLRPVRVAQIRAAADARLLMPEKTTYFAPKPRTGMVMRALEAG